MPSFATALALLSTAAVLVGPTPLSAEAVPAVAAAVDAFNTTCRRGFPSLDTVARVAAQEGWQEASVRPVGAAPQSPTGMPPRVFRKDGLTLFLTQAASGQYKRLCQVAGASGVEATGSDVVAALAPTLSGFEPRAHQNRTRDGAVWTFPGNIEIEAGTVRAGRAWSVSLVAREKH